MTEDPTAAEQRLVMIRHAKSSHPAGLPDHSRPLDERGWVEAHTLGRRLVDAGWIPEVVLCSNAVRTVSTWQRMASCFGPVRLEVTRRLYHAGIDALDEVVAGSLAPSDPSAPEPRCVFAVGHNPGWEEVVRELSGVDVQLPTATAALLRRAPVPWSAGLGAGGWVLVDLLRAEEP